MVEVIEINRVEELEHYRLLWAALLAQTRRASFFQSLDWLQVYWKHFGREQRLRVLIVRVEDEPIGILPLVVRPETTRVGKVHTLTYPLHDWGNFYGPIGPNPTATLRAGMRHLRRTPRDWDLLDLRWVDNDGRRTRYSMEAVGFRPHEQPWAQSAVVELQGTWQSYWGSRTSNWRSNVRRNTRRLAERGEIEFLRYRPEGKPRDDDDPRWDLFDSCVEVARRSWQGSSTTGTTLSHASVYSFLRDVHEVAARQGAIDMNLLKLDGRPIAFAYNYHMHGRVEGLRWGFDPGLAEVGPGVVLARKILEDSFRRGDTIWDLGVGSLEGKRYWITTLETSSRYTHFPSGSIQAQALRLKRWFTGRVHGPDYLAGEKQKGTARGAA